MDLQSFVGAVLARQGGVTQMQSDDRILALLPPRVAGSLDLPEEASLRLRGSASDGEVQAGFGTPLLGRICALADTLDRFYRFEISAPLPKIERVEREAEAALGFQAGTAKIDRIEPRILEYVVVDLQYVALSEDRHEGMVTVALDLDSGCSSPGLARGLDTYLQAHPEAFRGWTGGEAAALPRTLLERAARLALARVQAETKPFVTRMTRRLQRDGARIDDYYQALRDEVDRRRVRPGAAEAKLAAKIDAIEAETLRRHRDLERRYAVRLNIEPLAVAQVRASGLAVHLRLRRRHASAEVNLGWNTVARELDRWTCDACGLEVQSPSLCDALHRLCPECAHRCPKCGEAPRGPTAG
jgi:hypothetical protein